MDKLKVAIVAQSEYFGFIYGNDLDAIFNLLIVPMKFYNNDDNFHALLQFTPDITLFFRGEFVPNWVLEKLSGVKINWSSEPFPRFVDNYFDATPDSMNRLKTFLQIANKPFDYIFHYDPASQRFLELLGTQLSGYLPFAVASDTYKPVFTEKKWDIFFIGRTSQHRKKYFDMIPKKYKFLNISHGVNNPEDLSYYIGASRISLNLHAENECSLGSRMQLLMSCGALILSEPIPSNNSIIKNKHYVEMTNLSQFRLLLDDMLSNLDNYSLLQDAARQCMVDQFSVKSVFPKLIESVLSGRVPRPRVASDGVSLRELDILVKYNLLNKLDYEQFIKNYT